MSEIEDLWTNSDVKDYSDVEYPECLFHFKAGDCQFAVGPEYIEVNPLKQGVFSEHNLTDFIDDASEQLPIDVLSDYTGVVYSLDCETYGTDREFKREASAILNCHPDDIPSWAWAAHKYPIREYIGGTYRPDDRLAEHKGWRHDYDGATFTELFPVVGVNYVLLCLTDSVYELESKVAEYWQLDKHFDDTFVYQA